MWLTEARLRAARARIAAAVAGSLPPETLGDIRLRYEQRLAAARVADLIDRQGGALLADEVGRGKTFVALAVARRWRHTLVVAPAALKETWQQAMRRAAVHCRLISHESLSRRRSPAFAADGIIVDESHHFRSTTTRRYAALADVAARLPVLLISATPLQNRPRDLAAQLAIFLGMRAFTLEPRASMRFVVRTPMMSAAPLPIVAPPRWLALQVDDSLVLHAILALPAPPRALDAGDAGALRTIGLVRAWASSRAALRHMIERRRSAATAIEQSAESGVWPTRRELQSWYGGDGATQLGLPGLLASAVIRDEARDLLRRMAGAELKSLERIVHAMRVGSDPDACRIAVLRALRRSLADCRILVFSEFASTVRAYWSTLRSDPGVGLLTSTESRIASGRLPRHDLLGLFAPNGQCVAAPHPRAAITLLLATDLLSEGINLQDARVVVHLDLPWNPARLEQRMGRVRRPGGATHVRSYLMPPPASAELLLGIESRLRAKIGTAERTIGRVIPLMPSSRDHGEPAGEDPGLVGTAEALGEMHSRIAQWRRPSTGRRLRVHASAQPIVAGVVAAHEGWLAALANGRLIAALDGAPPDDEVTPIMAVRSAEGAARPLRDGEGDAACRALMEWLEEERLRDDCGLAGRADPVGESYERAIATVTSHAPRHQRSSVLGMAWRLRELLSGPRSLGSDRALLVHLRTPPSAERVVEWLSAAIGIASPMCAARTSADDSSHPIALIVCGRASSR